MKARGKPAISHPPTDEPPSQPPQTEEDKQPRFPVDKRSLKVFSTLFFQPSQTAQSGEIAWTDFLHAMSGTAFSVQKLYGSVWQFTPAEFGRQAQYPVSRAASRGEDSLPVCEADWEAVV